MSDVARWAAGVSQVSRREGQAMDGQPSFDENLDSPSGRPDPHREHLRELRAGLTLTAITIERGAAAFVDSMKLLNRLDGRSAARPAPADFTEANNEPSS